MSVNPFKPFDPYIASKLPSEEFAINLLTSVDNSTEVAAAEMQAKLIVIDNEMKAVLSFEDSIYLDSLVASIQNDNDVITQFQAKFPSNIKITPDMVAAARKAFKDRGDTLRDLSKDSAAVENELGKVTNKEEKLAAARRLVDERKGLPNNIAVPAFGGLFTQALSTQFPEKPGMAKDLSAAVAYLQISMRMDLLAQYGDLDYVEAKIFPKDPPELQSLSKTFNELIALRRADKAPLMKEQRDFYASESFKGFEKGLDILNKDFPAAAEYFCLAQIDERAKAEKNKANMNDINRSFLDAACEWGVRHPFATEFFTGLGIGFIARAGFTLAVGAVAMPLAPLAVVVVGGALAGGAVGVFREDFRAYKAKKENAANGKTEENAEQKIEKVRFIDKTILGVKIQTDFMVNPRVKAAFWGALTGGLVAGALNVGLNYVMENYMAPQAAAPQESSPAASNQASGNKISAANVSEQQGGGQAGVNNATAVNSTQPQSGGSESLSTGNNQQPQSGGAGAQVVKATTVAPVSEITDTAYQAASTTPHVGVCGWNGQVPENANGWWNDKFYSHGKVVGTVVVEHGVKHDAFYVDGKLISKNVIDYAGNPVDLTDAKAAEAISVNVATGNGWSRDYVTETIYSNAKDQVFKDYGLRDHLKRSGDVAGNMFFDGKLYDITEKVSGVMCEPCRNALTTNLICACNVKVSAAL